MKKITAPRPLKTRYLNHYQKHHPYHGSGKTLVITGTTTGTGHCLTKLAIDYGMRVIMLNRPSERVDILMRQFPKDATVENIDCDLASFASVNQAAKRVITLTGGLIDGLINNAGIMALSKQATENGFERQIQINHLSHFLLTAHLLPSLIEAWKQTGEARVINHTSSAGDIADNLPPTWCSNHLSDWGDDRSNLLIRTGGRWLRYGASKRANQYFTLCLHKKMHKAGIGVKSITAQPGLAQTMLQPKAIASQGMNALMNRLMFSTVGQSCEDGTLPLLHATCSDQVTSGMRVDPKYYLFGPPQQKNLILSKVSDDALNHFWTQSEQAVGIDFHI